QAYPSFRRQFVIEIPPQDRLFAFVVNLYQVRYGPSGIIPGSVKLRQFKIPAIDLEEMELHFGNGLKLQIALADFVEHQCKMIRPEPLGRVLAYAVGIQECLSQVHEVELMAERMQEPTHARGLAPEAGLEHIGMYAGDHPFGAEMIFFQFHEQDYRLLLSVVGESGVDFGKPVSAVEVQDDRLVLVQHILSKLNLEFATDPVIRGVEKDSQVFPSQLGAPVQAVARIIPFALFVFLAVETSEELIYLFRLGI